MKLLRQGLLFGILMFIVFIIWDYIKESAIDWSDNIFKAIIFAVVHILFSALMNKNEKTN